MSELNEMSEADIDEVGYAPFWCAVCEEEYRLPDGSSICPVCGNYALEEI